MVSVKMSRFLVVQVSLGRKPLGPTLVFASKFRDVRRCCGHFTTWTLHLIRLVSYCRKSQRSRETETFSLRLDEAGTL